MKKLLLLIFSLLAITVVIPVTAGIKTDRFSKTGTEEIHNTRDIPSFSETEREQIIANVMEYISEDACKETKRAILSISVNNAAYNKEHNITAEKTSISEYSDTFYDELNSMLNNESISLLYKNERVYIPLTKLCHGYIIEDERYPYITTVSSPWDKLSPDYNEDSDYSAGISVFGIEALCLQEYTAEQVLCRFLPDFTIDKI